VGADPGLVDEVGEPEPLTRGEAMVGGEQDADTILEERDQLDLVGHRLGLEVVLADDRHVELSPREAPQRGAPIDERIDDHELGMAATESGARLGREVDQRGEEGAEPHAAAAQPDQLGHLLLGERQAREDRVGVIGEQLPGLRGVHSLARAGDELGPDLALQQRDLPGDGGLGERQLAARRGERAERHHGAQGRELGQVQAGPCAELMTILIHPYVALLPSQGRTRAWPPPRPRRPPTPSDLAARAPRCEQRAPPPRSRSC
jgi:hypothetical protein